MKSPKEIVNLMLANDAFSRWMKLEIIETGLGFCTLTCVISPEMLNGFQILHGGITFSLSDSALAFASNSYGFKCVSVETSISHLNSVKVTDLLTVQCKEIHRGKSIGVYSVIILNQEDKIVSNFRGTVNISTERW